MTAGRPCPECHGPVVPSEGRGRPRVFCRPSCQRTFGRRIRRAERRIRGIEENAQWARLHGWPCFYGKPEEVAALLVEKNAELRALLAQLDPVPEAPATAPTAQETA